MHSKREEALLLIGIAVWQHFDGSRKLESRSLFVGADVEQG